VYFSIDPKMVCLVVASRVKNIGLENKNVHNEMTKKALEKT